MRPHAARPGSRIGRAGSRAGSAGSTTPSTTATGSGDDAGILSGMDYIIPAATRIGHVHLKVADLHRAEAFYRDVLGFEVQQHFDHSAAFLSAGGYHHHIG